MRKKSGRTGSQKGARSKTTAHRGRTISLGNSSHGGILVRRSDGSPVQQMILFICFAVALFVGVLFFARSRASLTDKYLFNALTPGIIDSDDNRSMELGLRFSSSQDGFLRGVRFYKSPANVDKHTGSLWTSTGTMLATGTFNNETASGWQRLDFADPVAIVANATYVVSYHTTAGHYSVAPGFFREGYIKLPLSVSAQANGVFAVSKDTAFPTRSSNASNYWVDPIFNPYIGAASATIFK